MTNDTNFTNLIKNTMENLKSMIDVETIIGDPIITSNDITIIPLSKLTFGFISGGSEIPLKTNSNLKDAYPFGGGSSSGVSIKPIALLVVKNDSIRLIPVNSSNSSKILDSIPQLINFIEDLCINNSEKKKSKHTSSETSSPI